MLPSSLIRTQIRAFSVSRQVLAKKTKESTTSTKTASKVSKSKKTASVTTDVEVKETKKAKSALEAAPKKTEKTTEASKVTSSTKAASKVSSRSKKTSTTSVNAGVKIKETKKETTKAKKALKADPKEAIDIEEGTKITTSTKAASKVTTKSKKIDNEEVKIKETKKKTTKSKSVSKISEEIKPIYNLAWPSPRCTLYPMKGQSLSSVIVFDPKDVPDYKVLFSIKNLQLGEKATEEKPSFTKISDDIKPLYNLAWPSPRCTLYPMKGQYLSSVVMFDPKDVPDYKVLFSIKNLQLPDAKEPGLNVQEIQTEKPKFEPKPVEDTKALKQKDTKIESTNVATKTIPSPQISDHVKIDFPQKANDEGKPSVEPVPLEQRSHFVQSKLKEAELQDVTEEPSVTDTKKKTEDERYSGNVNNDLILIKKAVDVSKTVINEAKSILGKLLKI